MRTLVLAALAATLGGPQAAPATLPYVQSWSEPGLISTEDDWSGCRSWLDTEATA